MSDTDDIKPAANDTSNHHDTGDLLDNAHMNLSKVNSLLTFLDDYLDDETGVHIEPDTYQRAYSLLDSARYSLEIGIEQLSMAHSQYLKGRVKS